MTKYKWEVRFHYEEGYWYIEKLVYMSLPDIHDETFETKNEAQEVADRLNKPFVKS